MNRQPVTSSDLRSVGYDKARNILEIEFNSSGVYQYFGVPASVYNDLMAASSKGKYFHQFIKDIYPYQRIG